MSAYRVTGPPKIEGHILLEPSKSISNRALIIQSLCDKPFTIHRLSKSDDTHTLVRMLSDEKDVLYGGQAGSSYRFMVAKACLGNKEVVLDASKQLRRRPIGPLVKALQSLGADIGYVEKEGFPPLRIKPSFSFAAHTNEVHLQSGISSQFVSGLLLIAPVLPKGLVLHLIDDPVSVPYIRMTLEIMQYFGAEYDWTGNVIKVSPGGYSPKDFIVESDWSAASYYYSMAAISESTDLFIEGLRMDSLQGDSIVRELYEPLNVHTAFEESGIRITKNKIVNRPKEVRYDFTRFPDIAQTVMVTLAETGIKGVLTGLQTLRIKESDRIAAMQTELARIKSHLDQKLADGQELYILHGKARWKDKAKFETYDDHRMAMAFAPLACRHPVTIKDPDVVTKSYPGFWKDLKSIGFTIEKVKS